MRYGVSYFWQFYVPALPFMNPVAFAYHERNGAALPSWSVWVGWNRRPFRLADDGQCLRGHTTSRSGHLWLP